MPDLKATALSISFPGLGAPVLDVQDLRIATGEQVAITGASGSGKSTLVNLLTGLERPSQGTVFWGETDIAALSESRRDHWRGETVGLVMQDFHLFAGLSAFDNVLLPARLSGVATPELVDRGRQLLCEVGLSRPDQHIETMSRGEMQRVAVARAVLRAPSVLVADEPTASLDPESGQAVCDLLLSLAQSSGSTLIIVSHDRRLIERIGRRIVLDAGQIVSDNKAEAQI